MSDEQPEEGLLSQTIDLIEEAKGDLAVAIMVGNSKAIERATDALIAAVRRSGEPKKMTDENKNHSAELAAAQPIPDIAGCIPASHGLAAAEAANVTLSTENAQLRQALRVIRKGLSDDSDGEFWPARRWLDRRDIFVRSLLPTTVAA